MAHLLQQLRFFGLLPNILVVADDSVCALAGAVPLAVEFFEGLCMHGISRSAESSNKQSVNLGALTFSQRKSGRWIGI